MGKKHKPRSGSLAYYPRKRAEKQTQHFTVFKTDSDSEECKPLNFLAYKAGMSRVLGTDRRKNSVTENQQVARAVTVLEAPPLKVFGIRAYGGNDRGKLNVLAEEITENFDKHLVKKLGLGKKGKKDKKVEGKEKEVKGKEGEKKEEKEKAGFDSVSADASEIRLLVHTQPYLTGIGKKSPDVSEVCLSGKIGEQVKYAKEKLGKDLSVSEFFEEKDLLDVKAVTKGKGVTGVVKRYGVKIQGRKAKTARIIGAIGPWHPATVLFTVGRAGQHGYHVRTEYNKKVLMLSEAEKGKDLEFIGYGKVKNDFLALSGSIAGPVKRVIALRKAVRPLRRQRYALEEVSLLG